MLKYIKNTTIKNCFKHIGLQKEKTESNSQEHIAIIKLYEAKNEM